MLNEKRRLKKVFYVLVAGALLSCSKETDSMLPPKIMDHEATEIIAVDDSKGNVAADASSVSWSIYKILKGNNFSDGLNFAPLNHDTIIVEFSFDSSAIYYTTLIENQQDWNKLIGFSDCGGFHQQNSARVVWRWNPNIDQIELGEYYYKKGEVSYNGLTSIAIGDTANIMMYATDSTYVTRIKDIQSTTSRPCKNSANRYWLLPYFGGDELSPNDISVHINHIFPKL